MTRNPAIQSDEIRRKLVWVMLFRVVAISILLGATLVRSFGREAPFSSTERILIAIIISTYAATVAYGAALRLWTNLFAQAAIQLTGDLLVASFICYYTGRNESIFTFLFPFYVIVTAILLYRVGAFVAAAAGTLALTVLAADQHLRFLPAIPGMEASTASPVVTQTIYTTFISVTAIFLVAALSSYLSEQIRITGRKLEEKQATLLDLTALHEAIVHSIPSGVITCSQEGGINFANEAACRFLGREARDLIGRRADEVMGTAGGGGLAAAETVYRADGAGYRVFSVHSGDLHDYARRLTGGLIVFQDITSYREMEEAVRRSEKLAALGKVAAGLAHEIRNPLAAITGSVELLQKGRVPAADSDTLMNIVSTEAERLNDLIEKFLQFARPSPPRFEDTDLSKLVAETVKVFRCDAEAGPAIEIRTEIEPDVTARVDPGQIKQVLWNLFRNAAQAVEGRGTVAVTLKRGGAANGHIALQVSDNGIGIPKDDLARVFDPFFTSKEKGTGLGLSIAYSIMAAHGGSITVESAPGAGSTFTVGFEPAKKG
ncbi:MAG: PAS domain S-box protein [Deltaproteobacteria bacterium]|nr:PAS domain S-box protein [Deltaproteobacteria bacterium]